MGYTVRISEDAERDLDNQIAWLAGNRGKQAAEHWYQMVKSRIADLQSWPLRWQKVEVKGIGYHRMVAQSSTLVFFTVDEEQSIVLVLAIRGAAEDWTNQSLPND